MNTDPTEALRRAMLADNQPLQDLAKAKQRWTTEEMTREFTVYYFLAPYVFVARKSDGKKGFLEFTHSPRFYFNFNETEN